MDVIWPIGKHKGRTIGDLVDNEPGYCWWAIHNVHCEYEVGVMRTLLTTRRIESMKPVHKPIYEKPLTALGINT